jgi:hypothetical protein
MDGFGDMSPKKNYTTLGTFLARSDLWMKILQSLRTSVSPTPGLSMRTLAGRLRVLRMVFMAFPIALRKSDRELMSTLLPFHGRELRRIEHT